MPESDFSSIDGNPVDPEIGGKNSTGKFYLPGLDGLRALAASAVLAWHVDRFAPLLGLQPLGYGRTNLAETAVTLFFVLSGYLITLLLLREKAENGFISIKNFYARRILRIWPPYYTILLISIPMLHFLPHTANWKIYTLYTFMLSNVAYALGIGIIFLFPLWSVAVEQQFYLVWPWVVSNSKNLVRTLVYIGTTYFAVKVGLRFFENDVIYKLWRLTAFDSLAIGGLAACLYSQGHRCLSILYSSWLQATLWLLLAGGVLFRPITLTSLVDAEIHSLIYAVLIINVSTNPRPLIRLENRLLKTVGKLSYGLYLYHLPVMAFLGWICPALFLSLNGHPARAFITTTTIYSTSLAVAAGSYFLMEKRVLNLRTHFRN